MTVNATTETALKTVSGQVQYFASEDALIAHYNRLGRFYEVRAGANGRELWHKGHKTFIGVIETIAARA